MRINYLGLFLLLIIGFNAEAQKKPVQTELVNVTLGQGLVFTQNRWAFAAMRPSVSNTFFWIRQSHIEKRVGYYNFGRHIIERRSGGNLQVIDSLIIDGNAKIFDIESDEIGNLYMSITFIDSLNLPGYDTLYPSAVPYAMLKIDSNLNIAWLKFETTGEFTVTPDGSRIYIRDRLGGLGGNTSIDQLDSAGNFIRTKTLNGIGSLTRLKAASDGSLFLGGGCSNQTAIIDSVNFGHSYSYNTYYAKLDSSLTAQWVVNIDDIRCEIPDLEIDSAGNLHFYANLNKSVQIGSTSLTKPLFYDDFIYTSTTVIGGLNYARECMANTSGVAFIKNNTYTYKGNSLSLNRGGAALVMYQNFTDTINWGGGFVTISSGSKDVLILEYDLNGNLIGASSYPGNTSLTIRGIYYSSDGSVIIGGHVYGYYIDDYYRGTINAASAPLFLQKWDVPGTVGLTTVVKEDEGMSIYPNPSEGAFSFSEKVSGRVLDMQGRVLLEFNQANQISLENHRDGLYFLQTNEGEVFKLIKR